MKAKHYTISITLLTALVFCQTLAAQRMGQKGFISRNQFGRELFLYKIYNFADPADGSKSRVDFYFSLVNDILTFVKAEDGTFKAKYEINIIFYNKKNQAIAENSVKNETTVNTYAETNSRINPYQNYMSVSLPPGEYHYVVKIIENNIPEILVEKTKINFRSFQDNRLHISDIVFVDKIDCSADSVIFKPNLNNSFDESASDFTAYLLLYPQKNSDSLRLEYKISNVEKAQVYKKSETLASGTDKIPYCIPFKDVIKNPGQYYLNIKVKSGIQSIDCQKIFYVNWSKVKLQQNNLELAIEQLKLISHKSIIAKIKDAPESERKELYDQFWKERDPTPGTPENELKTEFFQRINFANENFSENFPTSDGWRTDRGEIYIKFGPPTQVERQQSELSSPGIEIWYYANIDRKYYFADRNGNGSYRLVKID